MIRLSQIKLSLNETEQILKKKVLQALQIPESELKQYRIYKKSIDARRKHNIQFTYTIDAEVHNEKQVLKANKKLVLAPLIQYTFPKSGDKPLEHRPVIVGAGPCGLFAGWLLAEAGYKPILIERGQAIDERTLSVEAFWKDGTLNPQSNVQFGEGGAGTFSDGKLTTRIKDPRCRQVLEVLVKNGAPENILYEAKPHVGTDILKEVVKNIRKGIVDKGGEFRFNTQLKNLHVELGAVKKIELSNGVTLETDVLIMAIGHSARDTFEMLYQQGVEMRTKPFAIGVRIEHPQVLINKSQYGESYNHPRLGAAEYHLTYQTKKERAVYTFCMCPGGHVVAAASEEGHQVVNGMSYHARDGINANSALLVSVTPDDFESDHPLAGVKLQRKIEKAAFELGGGNYTAPVQKVGDFLKNKPTNALSSVKSTYEPRIKPTDLSQCLPAFIVDALKEALPAMGKRIKGFNMDDAVMVGVETRSSSPVRILRDKDSYMSSSTKGLYPAGEGAGYAGGIMSSAVDGIKIAEEIIASYKTE